MRNILELQIRLRETQYKILRGQREPLPLDVWKAMDENEELDVETKVRFAL